VAIDGAFLSGIPSMSNRTDISGGFPSFNTNGAGRGLFIDTTAYSNGVHTIGWLVTDSTDQADGVGSRFFTVANGAMVAASAAGARVAADAAAPLVEAMGVNQLPLRRRPQVIIDTPFVEQKVAERFTVAGWALDPEAPSGTGISTNHLWAYPVRGGAPIFLGAATMNGERPDVSNIYGDQFRSSGFGLEVWSPAAGDYTLAVFAWREADGVFLPAKTVKVSVR
jgi:hypothetical protein